MSFNAITASLLLKAPQKDKKSAPMITKNGSGANVHWSSRPQTRKATKTSDKASATTVAAHKSCAPRAKTVNATIPVMAPVKKFREFTGGL